MAGPNGFEVCMLYLGSLRREEWRQRVLVAMGCFAVYFSIVCADSHSVRTDVDNCQYLLVPAR